MDAQLRKLTEYKLSKLLDLDNENFDPSFIEKMADKLEEDGDLTDGQLSAINNIYDNWVKE